MDFQIGKNYLTNEVLDYIYSIHYRQQDFEDNNLEIRAYVHQVYELVQLDVKSLESPSYYLDEDLIEDYMELDTSMPPIVYHIYKDRKILIDGGHRLTIAKKKNLSTILALVGSDKPDWEEYNEVYGED